MPVDEARSPVITKDTATEIAAAVADGEARPFGIAKYMVTTKSQLAESPGERHDEAGPPWPGANGTSSVASSTVATLVDEAPLPESQSIVPQKIRTTPRSGMRVKRRSTSAR